ncbi:hypothetical protein ROLI_030290 [Roseobacter fucihabitans]|uniref:Uncharacterized protein n=1 Tax=Roseobacter fucihabitans TaxID=1537242 RepID=A0ABZ2BV53_9RHOB|nr:hypothetical protein [Roseobacter litoralis]MBC6967895.1 hypothetical protein [Roseobacter litoralis]MBC6968071.1 hypothetical protein [Roseobacter litoralis]
MRPVFGFSSVILLCLPVVAFAQDAKREFEISFFADNFAATVLPNAPRIKAGDLLRLQTLELEDSLEACMPGEWTNRYDRSPPSYSLSTGMKSHSGTIEARVASNFGLTVSGTVAADVRSAISATGFQIEADSVRLELRRIVNIINIDDPLCGVFVDALGSGYVPSDQVLVGNAFFVDGDIQYEFTLSLSGEAEGEITADRLVAFLNSVPFLSRIAPYFDASAGLTVGGAQVTSDTITAGYGSTGQRAIAFRPFSVNTQEAKIFFDSLIEASGGISSLAEIAADKERAVDFLQEFPQFILGGEGSFLRFLYAGEGLVPYQSFVNEQADFATDFAQTVSWVLTINAVAALN